MSDNWHFTVTEQHITLLRNANVSWGYNEFGAPCIDPKRPYGNGDGYADLARLIWGIEPSGEWVSYGDTMVAMMDRLHLETETALQIFLATGVMEPGEYEAPLYTRKWRKVSEPTAADAAGR